MVVRRQLTEQFVAEPVVASRVVETDFVLRPLTVEEVGPVDVLLDQQRNAVGYRTIIKNKKTTDSLSNVDKNKALNGKN